MGAAAGPSRSACFRLLDAHAERPCCAPSVAVVELDPCQRRCLLPGLDLGVQPTHMVEAAPVYDDLKVTVCNSPLVVKHGYVLASDEMLRNNQ